MSVLEETVRNLFARPKTKFITAVDIILVRECARRTCRGAGQKATNTIVPVLCLTPRP